MKRTFQWVGLWALLGARAMGAPPDNWSSTSSSLWGSSANWTGGVPNGGSLAQFNGSASLRTSLTLLPSSAASSLVFLSAGGASNYVFDTAATLNSNTMSLSSGITNSDTGSVTFYNATTLLGSQTWNNGGGAMTFNGNVNLGSGSSGRTLTISGAGAVNLNGVVANGGSSTGSLVMAGTGTLTLAGANTYTGSTTISSGIVQTNASGALHSGNTLSIGAAGTLNLNGTSQSVGAFTSSGALNLGSGGAFTLLGTATLAGTLSGTGTLTLAAGSILTLGANFSDSGINIVLNGGTLKLNGTSDTFGSLSVTSSSVVDFGTTGSSVLDVSGVSLTGSAVLSVQNWSNLIDYFYSKTSTGTQGVAPENQIVFSGYSGNATRWNSNTDGPDNGHQVSPIPEPPFYGATLATLSLAMIAACRAGRGRATAVHRSPGHVAASHGRELTVGARRDADRGMLELRLAPAVGVFLIEDRNG